MKASRSWWPRCRRPGIPGLAWILVGLNLACADSQQYLNRVWHGEDGLFNPATRAITQCGNGYLWLATDAGLVRFDGVRFKEIEGRIPGKVHDRWIVGLIEARDGSIWTSSVNGGISRLINGSLVRYTREDGLPDDQVLAIHEDLEGTIWIGSGGGLTRFRDGEFHTYDLQAVRAITGDREGNLWIGTAAGLNRLRDGRLAVYTVEDGLGHNSIMALHADRDDNIWIGTSDGLSVFDAARKTFERYTGADGLAHGTVRAIYQDRLGGVWVGSHAGLQRFRGGHLVDVVFEKGSLSHFSGTIPTFVYAIHEDREGNIWVGTNLALNQLKVHKFQTYSKDEGLPHELVTSVYEDRAGNLWIGTWGGGLARLGNDQLQYWTENDGLSSNFILGIHEDSRGNLWIGTDGDGLNLFAEDGGLVQYRVPMPPGRDVRAPNMIRVIFEDTQGNLWIGTNRGLYHFVNGRFQSMSSLVGGDLETVKTIVEDADGVLWIGSRQGLTRIEGNDAVTYGTEDGISGLPVNAILADGGALWLSTDAGGLDRFEDGRVTARITEPDNLLRERILHILEDDRGFFWMTTRNGIFRVNVQEIKDVAAGSGGSVSPISYGRAEGMRRAHCNGIAQPSGWKDRGGRLWFPTMDGAVVFDPARTPANELAPPVLIEAVLANGEPVELAKASRVPLGARNLEFHYTAPSLQLPERVRFRYKLEGFDSNWQEAGDARSATYNNLRPGDYTFRVIACNNDGVWNKTGATVSLSLPRHFRETFWFYGLGGLGLVIVTTGIYSLRVRQTRERERELTALIHDRTRELQEEIAERKEAERRAEALSKLGEKLSLASTFQEAAEVIFAATDTLFKWDAGCLYSYNAEEDMSHPILGYDIIGGRPRTPVSDLDEMRPSPMARRAILEGAQLVLRQDPKIGAGDCIPFGEESRLSASIMYVPVRKGSRIVGLLSVQSYAANAYGQRDLELLQSLGDYCAGALERIRAENALHESQQMVLRQERLAVVGQLSAGVAHEFNNILTIVQGHTCLALEDPALSAQTAEMLRHVSTGADRAAEMTRQLLAFSRKQTMRPRLMDLNLAINKLVSVLRRLLGENIEVQCRLQEQMPPLHADAGMMEQTIMNLAVNARDAMPKGGKLTISTRTRKVAGNHPHPEARPGNFICLEIADNGIGMDEETVRRVFEPFFSTKEVGKGTGLGLASTYGIVKQHQGWIEVVSHPGKGSSFCLFLPAGDPISAAGDTPSAAKPVRGGRETILIVEDEIGVRNLMRMALLRQGYRVIEAASGVEALRLWAEHKEEIDLLLTDMIMPGGVSGEDLAARILQEKPHLAVICSSGYNPAGLGASHIFGKGVTFFQKPYTPEALARIVRRCIDARSRGPDR